MNWGLSEKFREEKLRWYFFSSYLHLMHINVVAYLKAQRCFVYSGNQGNVLSLLFHKRHLLAESEFASHSVRLLILFHVDIFYVALFHKAKVRAFCFCFTFWNDTNRILIKTADTIM